MGNRLTSMTSVFAAVAVVAGMGLSQSSHADFIGDIMTARVEGGASAENTELVRDGLEEIGNWFSWEIGYNVQGDTIEVFSYTTGKPWFYNLRFEFIDLDWIGDHYREIVGVEVTSATGAGWENIDNSDLSFTSHSVIIHAGDIGGHVASTDQSVLVQIYVTDLGACCINEGCLILSEADCLSVSGTYMGDDTDCDTVTCPQPCPADLNGDGVVDINDIFEILGMWGVCP